MTPKIVLCRPSYGQRADAQVKVLLDLQRDSMGQVQMYDMAPGGSLLTHNFNKGWATALNLREQGKCTHFLLLHADIVPTTKRWLARMLQIMAEQQVEVLSVVVPLKSLDGLTSTARDTHPWCPVRYTMREVLQQPETWTTPDLLVNTGCLLVDMRKPWVESICFTINDQILRDPVSHQWTAWVEPEDWHFSRQCHRLGVSIAATRAIAVQHWGDYPYTNEAAWGRQTDDINLGYGQALVARTMLDALDPTMTAVHARAETIAGWFSKADMERMTKLIRDFVPTGGTVVEVGSWKGRASYVLAALCRERGAHLLCLDSFTGLLEPANPRFVDFQRERYAEAATVDIEAELRENLAEFDGTVDIWRGDSRLLCQQLPPGSIDLVFLDGDHDFPVIGQDLDGFWPAVKEGGVFCGHDYGESDPDVMMAVDERFQAITLLGTIWAVRKHASQGVPLQDAALVAARASGNGQLG